MARTFNKADSLVIASHNEGKVDEFRNMLKGLASEILSANQLSLDEPEETGTSFSENARLKALAAAKSTGKPCLGDDSGIVVPAIGGKPGIYSARWAGPNKDFAFAMDKINAELGDNPDRSAYFTVTLCLAWPDGHTEEVEGRINGQLRLKPAGTNGMGYDPWFQADGYDITFAEMTSDQKDAISHRGLAVQELLKLCFN